VRHPRTGGLLTCLSQNVATVATSLLLVYGVITNAITHLWSSDKVKYEALNASRL
jgi:hypothetical protein